METEKRSGSDTRTILAKRAAQVQRGSARAAVLGVNDGLVSTLCLVVGVAASGVDTKFVLTAGLAGLLAGAISMAAGEWVSVKTQVELFQGVLTDLKKAITTNKPLLMDNLAHTLSGFGMPHHDAHQAVKAMAGRDEDLTALYSSQVIGINQDELGSPWRVAVSSFLLFAAGSLVPLAPWLIQLKGTTAIISAIMLTALGGLVVGGYTARSSGKSVWRGAIRQLLIIVIAASATYGLGHLFGVAIS